MIETGKWKTASHRHLAEDGHRPGGTVHRLNDKLKQWSLLQNERRSEIERKIFWTRMSGEIARKRSSATLRTISPGRRRTGYF